METEFHLEADGEFKVTQEVFESYWKNGYIIVRSLLSEAEVNLLEEGYTQDPYVKENKFELPDDKGQPMTMAMWDDATMDASGLCARSDKLAGTVEKLVGDEVYHYHAKYLEKRAKTGGSFIWHQDYGYWYHNGNLYPNDMSTVYIAVDDIDEENGCLQIIPKSHTCGRVDHILYQQQIQADMERVKHYVDKMVSLSSENPFKEMAIPIRGIKLVEMKRGDALIFHSNILHTSSKNDSARRRLAFAVSYNTKRNNPIRKHHHPQYTKMDKVANGAMLEWGKTKKWDSSKKFYNPDGPNNHMEEIKASIETKG